MKSLTQKKVITLLSLALFLSSNFTFAAENLIQQGDFEGPHDLWIPKNDVVASTITSDTGTGNSANKVLELTGRTSHNDSAKQTVPGMIAGHAYRFTAKLKTGTSNTGEKVSVGTSYRLVDATDDTFVTIGTATLSEGAWVDYSATFTLPADFDETASFKIWAKSVNGTTSTLYGDDFVLLDLDGDNPPAQHSKAATYTSDATNIVYWTANDLIGNGEDLDIMRLSYSDTVFDSNTTNAEVNTWLQINTDWRWATPIEMWALYNFYDADEATNITNFKVLNGGVWSPSTTEQWISVTQVDNAGNIQVDGSGNITTGLKSVVKALGPFNSPTADSIDVSSTPNAALLVRTHSTNPVSRFTEAGSYTNVLTNDFWTTNNIGGNKLDIMRLSVSDNVGGPNGNFDNLDTYLASETTGWRYATEAETDSIAAFFNKSGTENGSEFLDLFGVFYSDIDGTKDVWYALTKTASQNVVATPDPNPTHGFVGKADSVSLATYRDNFNVGGKTAAALLVRVDTDGDGMGDDVDDFLTDASASIDTDNDGLPDELNAVNPSCDATCLTETTLIVDADDDNDAVLDTADAFTTDASASIDTDDDGLPDQLNAINAGCDVTCIADSTLVVDNDDDGDGYTDIDEIAAGSDSLSAGDMPADNDGDFISDFTDTDDDNDGVDDGTDDFPFDGTKSANTAPVITAPASIEVAATDADGTVDNDASIAAFLSGATATDVDGTVTITHNAPATFPLNETLVTFTATDSFGLTHTAQATLTITDLTKPIISLVGIAEDINVGGVYTDLGATALDNVDGSSLVVVADASAVITTAPGTYLVTYNVADTEGNSADEVTRSITVVDVVAPVIIVPTDITIDTTNENGTATTSAEIAAFLIAATASDDIDEVVEVVVTINGAVVESIDVLPLGDTLVTFTATDNANNSSTATATITVADLSGPVITLLGGDSITVPLNGVYSEAGYENITGEFIALGIDTVTDNIDVINVSAVTDIVGTVNLSIEATYTVTYTVLDVAGNEGTAIRTVIVQDAAAPVVTPPQNITVEATSSVGTENTDASIAAFLVAATAEDAIDGSLTATAIDALDVFPLGTTSVTFSSTDSENYTGTDVATIIVVDTTEPVITLLGDSAVTLAPGSTFTEQGATATDIVDGNVTVVIGGDTVNTSIQATYTVTYTAVDNADNAATPITRIVTVQDASAPVIIPPAPITVPATDANGTLLSDSAFDQYLEQATALDETDGTVTVTNDAPNLFPIGVTAVTFTAVDITGNEGTAQAIVTVADQAAPVITLTGDSVTLTVGDAYLDPGFTAVDNVDGDITVNVVVSGTLDTTTTGIYTLTYSVTDTATNIAEIVSREVTIITADRDGDGVIDSLDIFPDDANETLDTDGDTVGDNADIFPNDANEIADSDLDGLGDNADAFPNDANETVDTDNDGTGDNSDVFPNDPTQQVTDIIAPVFAENITTITLDATGIKTNVEQAILDSNIIAVDGVDGAVSSVITTPNLVLKSGQHTINLSATDSVGNIATAEIELHIKPLVELGTDVTVEAGSQLTVPVKLSGAAAIYPVAIDYSVTTTTGETTGQVTIDQDGIVGEFTVAINNNAQTGDVVTIKLTQADNAMVADATSLTANVKNDTFAPTFNVSVEQAEQTISTISPNSGFVSVTTDISDINTNDEHTVTFEVVDTTFSGKTSGELGNVFTFDPANIDTGKYKLKITVTENNNAELLSTEAITTLYVDAAQTEVVADSDQDGIPDAVDTDSDTSRLPITENGQQLQVQTGLKLVLGELAQGTNLASIPEEILIEDRHFDTVSSIISFEVKGLNLSGESVAMVLPLAEGVTIPESAVYRKFTQGTGWFNFVEDENNSLSSAPKDDNGNCPTPASTDYADGLVEGSACIQLTIEDGGDNDADGLANGIIVDPGVLVTQLANVAPTLTVYGLSAFSNADVTVTATSTDYEGDRISYTWTQVSGPVVELTTTENNISFTAPEVQGQLGGIILTFKVEASDGIDVSTEIIEVEVSKNPQVTTTKSSGGSLGFWSMILLGLGLKRRTKK